MGIFSFNKGEAFASNRFIRINAVFGGFPPMLLTQAALPSPSGRSHRGDAPPERNRPRAARGKRRIATPTSGAPPSWGATCSTVRPRILPAPLPPYSPRLTPRARKPDTLVILKGLEHEPNGGAQPAAPSARLAWPLTPGRRCAAAFQTLAHHIIVLVIVPPGALHNAWCWVGTVRARISVREMRGTR